MNSPSSGAEPSLLYMDVKLEAIMPRIVFEAHSDAPSQRDRPKSMQVQVSRFAITNIREMGASRADLAHALSSLQEGSLVFGSGFPSKQGDLCIVTDRILSHVAATDITPSATPPSTSSSATSTSQLTRYALWTDPRDVWCIKLDPVWIEFLGVRSIGPNRPITFMDAVPVTLWIHGKSEEPFPEKIFQHKPDFEFDKPPPRNDLILNVAALDPSILDPQTLPREPEKKKPQNSKNDTEKMADLHIIAHLSNLVSIQVDHYQLLFLLRFIDDITELTTFLSLDADRIMKDRQQDNSIIVGCVIPQVEVSLVMPSQTPGKESSAGDVESVLPDSASLGDDLHTTWPQQQSSLELLKSSTMFNSVDTPSPVEPYTPAPNTQGHNVQIQTPPAKTTPLSSQKSTPQMPRGSKTKNIPDTTQQLTKEINSGLSSMKKGFSHFMTSIDSALKTSVDDDSLSIHSDYSSDSENFVMIMGDDKTVDCIDVMFKLNPFATEPIKVAPIEEAAEVFDDQESSPSEPSEASTFRRRDLVSMATFRYILIHSKN